MKRLLLLGCSLFAAFGFSQTTIYQENFETGNTFNLNTTDLGGASTYNIWLMNNAYSGGSGTLSCLGFPFSFTVANTPSQPIGIVGAPSSNYMHISAQAAITSGITCASFVPSDGGTCVSNESNFSRMTTPISTVGYTGVALDFWWMCAGSPNNFGEVYYSTNGGTTWTLKQSNMQNVTNWTQASLTDPAWDNQVSLLFAYRFVNNTASTAADPSFSVDEILVTGMTSMNAITVDDLQPVTNWCFGDVVTMQLTFTATGTYNSGNIFTAELSDASGSFASPTVIGTLSSSASGTQLMPALTIPGTVPVGNGYRVRVVASDPATIGSDNGVDLTVYPLPSVSSNTYADVCVNGAPVPLNGGLPSGGNYTGTGVSGGNFNPSTAGVGTTNITYTVVDTNGCQNSVVETINVLGEPNVQFNLSFNELCEYAAPYTLVEGTPAGGTYSGPGVTGNVFDPSAAGVGVVTLTYTYTDGNGCTGIQDAILNVSPCAGIIENKPFAYDIYPNPAESNFMIVSEVDFQSIDLVDLNGRLIQTINSNELVNITDLSTGVYLIEMNVDGQVYTERILVK